MREDELTAEIARIRAEASAQIKPLAEELARIRALAFWRNVPWGAHDTESVRSLAACVHPEIRTEVAAMAPAHLRAALEAGWEN